MAVLRAFRTVVSSLLLVGSVTVGASAHAEAIPASVDLPKLLTLDEALRILHTRGLDLLVAEAAVASAQGDELIASAVPNPSANFVFGECLSSGSCTAPTGGAQQYSIGLADSAAIEDTLSGKRHLRIKVARAALEAARHVRGDAERTLAGQVKGAYAQVAAAAKAIDFAKEIQKADEQTLDLNRKRYPGAIDEGALARIEIQKLEADQALEQATANLRQARVSLAFLLGVRGIIPDFDVETSILDFRVPAALESPNEQKLIDSAVEHRPDLKNFAYQRQRAAASIELAKRQRFPDITLSAQLSTSSVFAPAALSIGLSAPIPAFYQMQGEIKKAESDYNAQSLYHAKAVAQIASDVGNAYVSFVSAKALVERMEKGGLLDAAKKAKDITEMQYKQGAGTLMDFLDALRTYVATKQEYLQIQASYWTAVYQLEQAVGVELRK